MLKHRNGTLFEYMCWLDPDTAEIVAVEFEGMLEEQVDYSETTMKLVDSTPGLLTIHTHPNSLPPSATDFNSNYKHDYILGIICCHDGRNFVYNVKEEIDIDLYTAYVQKSLLEGKDEFAAQWAALEAIKESLDISFKEVSTNG